MLYNPPEVTRNAVISSPYTAAHQLSENVCGISMFFDMEQRGGKKEETWKIMFRYCENNEKKNHTWKRYNRNHRDSSQTEDLIVIKGPPKIPLYVSFVVKDPDKNKTGYVPNPDSLLA